MSRLSLIIVACLLMAGFSHWPGMAGSLAQRLVAPGGASPLLQAAPIDAALSRLADRSGHVTTAAGVKVFWRAVDPGHYRLRMSWPHGGSAADGFPTLDFDVPHGPTPVARGTVVLLHGWMMDGDSMLPWALRLGEAGYRTIAIDLRNHGRSGAAPSGYGTREASDVVEVVATLRERGEVVGPLHVLGVSYGAATAIFAGADPRLGADRVVALESFAEADTAIRDMVPYMVSGTRPSGSGWLTRQWMRWQLDEDVLDAAIDRAGQALDLPLASVDVGAALAHVPCPLLVHGAADRHVPVAHGRALAAGAPHARYIELAGEDHLSLPMRLDVLAPRVIDWLERPGTECDRALAARAARAWPPST
jgi:pimeloyl-ACP methyl ester carboxylesterase